MKIYGQHVKGPNTEVLVIPRGSFDIQFTAQAILDDTPFEALCKRPKPPRISKAGTGEWTDDLKDKDYLSALDRWGRQHTAWTIIKSLEATPKEILEWEKVNLSDPNTWLDWQKELKDAFFTDYEIVQIQNLVFAANGLNQQRLDEARNRFLAGTLRPFSLPQSPTVEQKSTQSGEPVKDSI